MKYTNSKPMLELSRTELKTVYDFVQALNQFCHDDNEGYSLFDIFEEIEDLYDTIETDGDFSQDEDAIFTYNITD